MKAKREGAVIVKNASFNMVYRLMGVLFPLITVPYLSRILLPEGIGQFNLSVSIVNYFLIFSTLGIPQYGIRVVAQSGKNRDLITKCFSEVWLINAVISILCTMGYYGMISFVPGFEKDYLLYALMGTMIPLNMFKIDWLMRGLEKYKYIAVRSVIVKTLSLLFILIYVKEKNDLHKYAIIYISAIYGNELINWISLKDSCNLELRVTEWSSVKRRLIPILILAASQIAIDVYTNLDITMVGIVSGDWSVGIYTNAEKVIKMIVTLIVSVCAVLLPRFSQYVKEGAVDQVKTIADKMFLVIIGIATPIMVGVFCVADTFALVMFGEEFSAAGMTMKVFAPMILILSCGYLFGSVILLAYQKEQYLLVSVVAGAVLNFCMNMVLIPRYAQNGAAFASVTAEFVVFTIQFILASRLVKVRVPIRLVLGIFFASVAMGCVVTCVNSLCISSVLALGISIVVGAILYFGIMGVFVFCEKKTVERVGQIT